MKKLLSIILAVIMMLSTLPVGLANAAYENTYKNTGNQRTDIIEVAKTQLGYREGSNNDTKYGTWYGLPNNPWCAMFVSWCARQAGVPKSVIPNLSYVPHYSTNGAFAIKKSGYTPKSGDIFLTKSESHVGLVWYTEGSYFYTIEGNSNNNGSSEGTSVVSNKRLISSYYFAVPNYGNEPAPTTDNSFPYTFKCRTISTANVKCYDSVNGSSAGNIYPTDDCEIQAIYTNGWVKCRCPWDNGTVKTVYVKKSVFINSSSSAVKMTAPKYALTYLRAGDSSSWGWIDKGDTIYKVATSGNMTQVIYPASSGLRCAWVKSSELVETHRHSYSSSVTTQPTCTKAGVRTYKCSCGASYTESIAKKAHNIVTDNALAATCTKTGLTEGKHCSTCGTITVVQQNVEKVSHYDNNFDGKCEGCGISSSSSSESDAATKECSCKCHKGDFFFNIILFFQKLFGMNKICICGIKH